MQNEVQEKKEYLAQTLNSDPKLMRKYREVNKYCKIIKVNLDSILLQNFKGGDLNRFLESIMRKTLITYFSKMLKFENVKNEEELYNTLYYLSFEYIKIVKKDEARKDYIDKQVQDLKILVHLFSNQALKKEDFKKIDFKHLSSRKIVSFLLESNIKLYQGKSKKISKEESEANIIYSLVNLYMTSELERYFLNEHLDEYKKFKKTKDKLNEDIVNLNRRINELNSELIRLEVVIEQNELQLEKKLNHNVIIKKIFLSKKIKNLELELDSNEKKEDSYRSQNKNNKKKLKVTRTKLTKLENEFKASFDQELQEINKQYETNLIINLEDFEDKNKLKKKSVTISKDIIERLANINIKVEKTNFTLNDYVKLKKLVNDYKEKFSNKNIYHNKIIELLDKYGYYLKD